MLTDRYERLMHPEIGSDLRALLFENFTPVTIANIRTRIQSVLTQFGHKLISNFLKMAEQK